FPEANRLSVDLCERPQVEHDLRAGDLQRYIRLLHRGSRPRSLPGTPRPEADTSRVYANERRADGSDPVTDEGWCKWPVCRMRWFCRSQYRDTQVAKWRSNRAGLHREEYSANPHTSEPARHCPGSPEHADPTGCRFRRKLRRVP